VTVRSKAHIFCRLNAGVMGSKLTRIMAVYPCVSVFLLCVGRGPEMGRFPAQEILLHDS
jgi:hypothetical protein